MIDTIHAYFSHRGLKTPDFLSSVMFAQSEMGELADAIMRAGILGDGWVRNNERETDINEELADAYMMLELAAAARGETLAGLLMDKMERKGYVPEFPPDANIR